jgi:hypothetical protein
MFDNFFSENGAFHEVIWKNMVDPDRQQMTKWLIRFACWKTKATNTHSEYVILTVSPRQQSLGGRLSV